MEIQEKAMRFSKQKEINSSTNNFSLNFLDKQEIDFEEFEYSQEIVGNSMQYLRGASNKDLNELENNQNQQIKHGVLRQSMNTGLKSVSESNDSNVQNIKRGVGQKQSKCSIQSHLTTTMIAGPKYNNNIIESGTTINNRINKDSIIEVSSQKQESTISKKKQKTKNKYRGHTSLTPPSNISQRWRQILKVITLKVKCSAIFSPFEIQKQLNDLSAAHANQENIGIDIEEKQRKKQNSCQKIGGLLLGYYQKIKLFSPSSRLSYWIDMVLILCLFCILFTMSINVFYGFGEIIQEYWFKIIYYYVSPIVFGCDMIKSIFSSTYINGLFEKSHQAVIIHYFKKLFVFDILSLVPFLLPESESIMVYNFFTKCLHFFKLVSFRLKYQRFMRGFQSKQSSQLYAELFSLCSFILSLSYMCSILYHALGVAEIKYFGENELTWLHQADIINSSVWVKYINSFYCSTSSMVTVLIFVPKTLYEMAYLTFIMLVNCGVFGYSINELGQILENIKKSSKELKSDLLILNRYLSMKKVNNELQARIVSYLEYNHQVQKELNLQQTQLVIQKLPTNLRDELKRDVNLQYIRKVDFFTQHFSKNFIENIIYNLVQEYSFTTDELIFKENDVDDLSWYYITQGSVQVVQNVGKREMPQTYIKELKQGDQFGLIEFITGSPRYSGIKCMEFCNVLKISRDSFLQALKQHEYKGVLEEFEKFCTVKDNIIQKEYHRINMKCYTCAKSDHISCQCPNTHLIFNKVKKQNLLKSQFQERNLKYVRKEIKNFGIEDYLEVESEAFQFIQNQSEFIENYQRQQILAGKGCEFQYSDGYFSPEDSCDDFYQQQREEHESQCSQSSGESSPPSVIIYRKSIDGSQKNPPSSYTNNNNTVTNSGLYIENSITNLHNNSLVNISEKRPSGSKNNNPKCEQSYISKSATTIQSNNHISNNNAGGNQYFRNLTRQRKSIRKSLKQQQQHHQQQIPHQQNYQNGIFTNLFSNISSDTPSHNQINNTHGNPLSIIQNIMQQFLTHQFLAGAADPNSESGISHINPNIVHPVANANHQILVKKQQEDLEKIKKFKIYKPHNNFNIVLNKINQKQIRNLQILTQNRKNSVNITGAKNGSKSEQIINKKYSKKMGIYDSKMLRQQNRLNNQSLQNKLTSEQFQKMTSQIMKPRFSGRDEDLLKTKQYQSDRVINRSKQTSSIIQAIEED